MKKKTSPLRKTSKDLVAKKKTTGGGLQEKAPEEASKVKWGERKSHPRQTQVETTLEGLGCGLHKVFSVGQGTITQILNGEHLTITEDECSNRGRNRL